MWALRSVVALAVSASLVAALPSYDSSFKVKETVAPPRNWVKYSAPPPDHTIVLRIGLPQPNFDILEEQKEQVEELVSPHPDSVDAVNKWLYSHGIAEADLTRTPAQDWVTVRVPVRLAEKMLDTTYHIWQHTEDGDYLVRTTSYSLPEELLGHVDLIQPTTMFGRFKGAKSTIVWDDDSTFRVAAGSAQSLEPIVDAVSGVTIDPTCNTTITVSCLKQLYNAVGYVPSAKGNSIGLTGYLEEYANIQDLQSFYKDQVPDAVNSSFDFISVHGGLNNQSLEAAGGEANLDVQFALGISHPVPGTFYSTAGRPPFTPSVRTPSNTNEPYTDWLDFVLSHPNPPLTISTSYGDDEQTVPESFAKRACNGFAQLGARGVSVIFSSGDFGVGDGNPNPATQQCFTNHGANVTRFIPAFPASCPFVTSVGGTQNINPEVAVSRFFSGGGFSDYFKRPAYQDQHVGEFLNGLPKGLYKGLFNRGGRGIPDVAAQGDRFRIFLSGVPRSIGGTSASAPTFAGIVALLNDARLKSHKRPLGFLNPLLYKKGFEGLNDIVSGKNPGCGTQGFNATKGWDPVTGLGTPNFGKLKEIVLKA